MKNISKILSFKDIAELSNVSVSTAVRVMKSCREAIKAKDSVEFEKYIDMDTTGLSRGVAKAINTIKKHKEYIVPTPKS